MQESTALGYLDELDRKYGGDRRVADTPRNRQFFTQSQIGESIAENAQLVLEVPVQNVALDVNSAICIRAGLLEILIMDVVGRTYC